MRHWSLGPTPSRPRPVARVAGGGGEVRVRGGRGAVTAGCLGVLLVALGGAPIRSVVAATIGALRPVDAAERPGLLDDGDLGALELAVSRSLGWVERQPPGRLFAFGPRRLTAAEHAAGLRRFLALLADRPPPEVLEQRVLAEFDVLAAGDHGDGSVLVTGYHEPVIDVAARPSTAFPVPIPALRDDPARGQWRDAAYPSRAEVEAGRLGHRARPLAWARDPVDVFFLEIEGSGTLRFPDGREIRVGPAATNGRPYRSIGRLLIDEGRLTEETVSMAAIRSWLAANPAERSRVLRHNPAVVFFRRLEGGPLGSLGVPITPARSIAVAPRWFPAGALAFVRAERPRLLAGLGAAWSPLGRFVLVQDAGGAVRGPARVDVFWGRGADAELAASEMKQLGELYVLVPKAVGGRGPSAQPAAAGCPLTRAVIAPAC